MSRNKAAIRKQEIMETALKLFITKGYEKTTTNDILNALQLSRGGLYHHFLSKEDILDSAISMLFHSEIAGVEAVIKNEELTAVEKLKFLIEFRSPSQPVMDDVKTILHAKDNPTLVTRLLRKKLEIVTPLFVDITMQGIKEGIFKCKYPEEASKIAIILSTLLFSDTFFTLSADEFDRMAAVFQSAVEAIVGAESGTFDFMKQSIIIGESRVNY